MTSECRNNIFNGMEKLLNCFALKSACFFFSYFLYWGAPIPGYEKLTSEKKPRAVLIKLNKERTKKREALVHGAENF